MSRARVRTGALGHLSRKDLENQKRKCPKLCFLRVLSRVLDTASDRTILGSSQNTYGALVREVSRSVFFFIAGPRWKFSRLLSISNKKISKVFRYTSTFYPNTWLFFSDKSRPKLSQKKLSFIGKFSKQLSWRNGKRRRGLLAK